MTRPQSLKSFFIGELRELYCLECRSIEMIPPLLETAAAGALRDAIAALHELSARHKGHIEEIAGLLRESLEASLPGRTAAWSLDEPGTADRTWSAPLGDIRIAGRCRQLLHQGMVSFDSARAIAEQLELEAIADILQQCADEKADADEELGDLCEHELLPACPAEGLQCAAEGPSCPWPAASHR